MKATGSFSSLFKNSIIDVDIHIDDPYSGFDFTVYETGLGIKYDIFNFSGSQGYVYDQSGRFFGGYRSGQSINITTHYDYSNDKFKYYFNNTLVANDMDPTNNSKGINSIEFEKNGNSTLEVNVTGQAKESLSEHATKQVDSRISTETTLATNGGMFTNFTDPNGTLDGGGFGASRSNDFWAKDIDFTSVVVWNNHGYDADGSGLDFRARCATAITKRHIIMAKHFKLVATNIVYFVDSDGNWISRTISAIADHASEDITVGVLNEDLPEDIAFAKILPSDINTFFKIAATVITEKTRPIVVGFNIDKQANLRYLRGIKTILDDVLYTNSASDLPDPYDNLEYTLSESVPDSSNPLFIIIDGEAVLLTSFFKTTYSPSYSAFLSDINTLIASADSAAGVTTNLTLTEFNLDAFSFLTF